MGGVLVDVHRDRAVCNFKAIGVHDADELIDAYHHKGLFFDFENGDIDTAGFCRLLSEYVGKPIPRVDIENAWRSIIDPPLTYKLEYLKQLRKKYKLFLLTNNNPIIIDWASSPDYTSSGSLSSYFDKFYISYQMKCMKPDLKIYRMLIEDAAIDPAETLFIDDSDRNIQAAKKSGMAVYLAKNASDWRNELTLMINSM